MSQQHNSWARLLECPICLNTYKNPKVLPCQHNFCLICLQKIKNNSRNVCCPLCKKEVVLLDNKSLDELPTNYTLNKLADLASKQGDQQQTSSVANKNSIYRNVCIECQTNGELIYCSNCFKPVCHKCQLEHNSGHANKETAAGSVETSSKFPKKEPLPLPNDENNQKFVSASTAEMAPPTQPLRILPNDNIKLIVKIDYAEKLTPKIFRLDSKRNVYVNFTEVNAGIRKYNTINRSLMLEFGRDLCIIEDFVLNLKSDTVICLVSARRNNTFVKSSFPYLQTYNSENGQMLEMLTKLDITENYSMLCPRYKNEDDGNDDEEYILAGDRCVSIYSTRSNSIRRLADRKSFKNLPDFKNLLSIDCNRVGNAYLLFANQPGRSHIVYVLSLNTSIVYPLPIFATDFVQPKSISITPNNFYICDYGNRCVSIYRKTKPEITKGDGVLNKTNFYDWQPSFVQAIENLIYILDVEKKCIYFHNDFDAL